MVKVKVKKLTEKAKMPTRAHKTDAGFDLTATSVRQYENCVIYGTGIAVEIPEGYVGYVFPRSSIYRKGISLTNSVGIIDSGYRGEIKAVFRVHNHIATPTSLWARLKHLLTGKVDQRNMFGISCLGETYEVGDRIGQLVIRPLTPTEFVESETLKESDRGEGGYGSTGK